MATPPVCPAGSWASNIDPSSDQKSLAVRSRLQTGKLVIWGLEKANH
jgi:hypothetical protein